MKDAKGHGSNSTGGRPFGSFNAKTGYGEKIYHKGEDGKWQAETDGHPKTTPVDTHPAWQHDAPQYHARVSAKNGRALGTYGPNPDRDAVIKEAFDKHPRAKTVSSSRGHGMDIRWHNR